MRADGPTTVKFWAVAKVAGANPQVAVKFNDLPPVLMSAEGAREFAAAVNAELEGVDRAAPVQPTLRLA
jgi:hypothetical protein